MWHTQIGRRVKEAGDGNIKTSGRRGERGKRDTRDKGCKGKGKAAKEVKENLPLTHYCCNMVESLYIQFPSKLEAMIAFYSVLK